MNPSFPESKEMTASASDQFMSLRDELLKRRRVKT